ncbi:hypothetical protein L1765_13195 [Microaerobacter geothermalis]|uniref:asparagine synthetase B family protein n=1 Tax=Microaerobacter geothermalis TaxID=674972 RepID=UPI001F472705|nr:hypothetical protein [Microaerobacter geothermalis]MCF6094917.1 hypothetical protein [Microaerobacter geothermalis]
MCGICGIIDFKREVPNESQLHAMLPALEKRGPDHQGMMCKPGVAFGHRRLSIIDLTHHGHQSMEDTDLGLSITYNGEIYNYKVLKDELIHKGYRFFSNSDTEVILKSYHAWGDDFVKRLNGMFAFCIYDQNHQRFLLGRDRLGIKPLYYTEKRNQLFFASNIQALKEARVVSSELSRTAFHYYLTFHAVVPAPYTIFEHVKKEALL